MMRLVSHLLALFSLASVQFNVGADLRVCPGGVKPTRIRLTRPGQTRRSAPTQFPCLNLIER